MWRRLTCSLHVLTAMASAAVAEWAWGVVREVTFMPMSTGDWGEPGLSIPPPSLSLECSCGRQDWPDGGGVAGVRLCVCGHAGARVLCSVQATNQCLQGCPIRDGFVCAGEGLLSDG